MALSMINQCRLVSFVSFTMAALLLRSLLDAPGWITGVGAVMSSLVAILTLHMSLLEPAASHSWGPLLQQYLTFAFVFSMAKFAIWQREKLSHTFHKNQSSLLKKILQKNAGSSFGSKFAFSEITSREDYKTKVPLQTYKDIEPYVENIANGQQKQLTQDDVVYLVTSSGTTGGKNKLIPVTAADRKLLFSQMIPGTATSCQQWRLGRHFFVYYRTQSRETPSGLMAGPAASRTIKIAPSFLSPRPVYDISEEPVVLYLHALYGLRERDIWRIDGVFATLFLSFWRLIEENWQDICDDIELGTIRENLKLDDDVRRQLSGTLKPDPKRAGELREEFIKGFTGIAGRVWTNVDHLNVVTSGSFALHANILRETYCKGWVLSSTFYAASEGFLGINLNTRSERPLYTMTNHHIFYEFIPEEHIDEEQPETLFIDQVEVNKRYELALTTDMGLYRYRLGDVIEIADFKNQLPLIEFKYRAGQMLSVHWEKMPETVFYSALQDTISQLEDIDLVDYTTTESINLPDGTESLVPKSVKCYVLFIEIESRKKESFVLRESDKAVFDATLQDHFENYHILRGNSCIGPMKVIQVKGETFKEFKLFRVKNTPSVQFKMPRVVRDETSVKFMLGKQMNEDGN